MRGPVVVAYGADKAPADAAALHTLPCLRLEPERTLRLHSEQFVLPPPAIGQEGVPVDVRLAEHIKRLSGGWNRTAGLFVDGYFDHLRREIAAHREEIAARLSPLAGLFAPEDVLYSAPLPLPRAVLPLPGAEGSTGPVQVDMLFWLEDRAEVVLFAPSPLLPAAERRRRARLADAGIGVTELAAADLTKPGTFAALLGESGGAFWRDEALPTAPGIVVPDF